MKCDQCGKKLIKKERRNEMADLDEDASDGQISDYLAAEESGDHGAWNLGIVEYFCNGCERTIALMSDELKNYRPLIINWHEKAKEGDYFSRFVFEYLAFVAHLKNNLFVGASRDRAAIQNLKQDEAKKAVYLRQINENKELNDIWINLIRELNRQPLFNTSHDMDYPEIDSWWNEDILEKQNNSPLPKGTINSITDWGNMVEFWYAVRNNLFHGGKDPSIKRDQFLVEHAYRTLAVFMDNEIVT